MKSSQYRVIVAAAMAFVVGGVALAVKAEPRDSLPVVQVAEAQPVRRDPAAVFAMLDTNKDGFVSRDEFLTAHRPGRNADTDQVKTRREAIFARLDTDHDGKLSPQEFAAFHR